MVSAIVRWIKDKLGISEIERENVQLTKALSVLKNKPYCDPERVDMALRETEDHEARIAFLEKSLTAKQFEAKIVPKAHKPNWKQFRSAIEKASEPEQETE